MISFLIPLAALAVNFAIQVGSFRRARGKHFFASILRGFAGGLLALLVFQAFLMGRHPSPGYLAGEILVNISTYAALAYCYYNFVQLGQTSIRLRLYAEIAARAAGMPVEEIAREYSEDGLMEVRVHRLIESGDLVRKGDRYFVGRRRLVHIGRILFAAKLLLLGKASEFDT